MNKNENAYFVFARTDLAYDEYQKHLDEDIPDFVTHSYTSFDIPIHKSIVGEKASEIVSKKPGNYYTIDLSKINIHDTLHLEKTEKAVAEVLVECLKENHLLGQKAFVVGLGNSNVTPDAIGPIVIDNTIVTRHLANMNALSEGFSNVCAMSPGVMGTTGIETYDVIETVLEKVKADFVIVIDALATNSVERINKTIQITDTGIKPGSGVGNKRKEISFETLHKPVIAIGIPTVVDATTITVNTIQMVLKYLNLELNGKTSKANALSSTLVKENLNQPQDIQEPTKVAFFGQFGSLSEAEQRTLVEEVLTPNGFNLMVTPKEIDTEVDDLSKIIANSINLALHPGLYNGYSE
ncbi:MAG: GPR endopeptidase [Anaeroplasma bactoclasticum]|nr:GPR endopeptidase [Anaeroplasma bactoclasticum]